MVEEGGRDVRSGSAGWLGIGARCAAPAPRGGGGRVAGITDGLGVLTSVMVTGELQYMEKWDIGKKCEEEG